MVPAGKGLDLVGAAITFYALMEFVCGQKIHESSEDGLLLSSRAISFWDNPEVWRREVFRFKSKNAIVSLKPLSLFTLCYLPKSALGHQCKDI